MVSAQLLALGLRTVGKATEMRVQRNPMRRSRKPPILTLADRKRMLVEAIGACNEPTTIAALEATLVECAARFLSDDNT